MRVVHRPRSGAGAEAVLATDVEIADTFLARARGLMFRPVVPEGFGLYFSFRGVARRAIHTLFVRQRLDVLWLANERVERVATLSPWTGFATAPADALVELPAGVAADVRVGDCVRLETAP
jgi:uncharacterized membrane protein (UPF0127 family)